MKLDDYLNLTPEQMTNMSESELDSAISFMRKSNKQLLRKLKKSPLGTHSPAYKVGKESDMFSKKSMDKEVSDYVEKSTKFVREEAERKARITIKRRQLNELIAWRKLKTSTPSGWKKVRKQTGELIGMSVEKKKKRGKQPKLTYKFETEFWDVFNQFQEEYITDVYNEGSPVIMEIIASVMREHADWSKEEVIKEAKRQLDEYRQARKKKRSSRTSDIFDY